VAKKSGGGGFWLLGVVVLAILAAIYAGTFVASVITYVQTYLHK
jgi:hypothetical protein